MDAGEEDTNVRVAARIRPLLPREIASNCCSCVTVVAGNRQVTVGTRRAFAFDVVFDTDSTQVDVYEGCVASLLDGCMQGYNGTILAYGQTGSGKTHTMGTGQASPSDSPGLEGITPKVIRNSFAYAEASAEVDFKVSCCFLEIYNEEIRDLLQPTVTCPITIRETADGVIQVAGLHAERCQTADEMLRCLSDGSVQRTTGATLMNENSSRSHSIFTVILEQRRRGSTAQGSGGSYRTAKFHLVDLAGSERAKRTGAVGSRLKESVNINGGLLALGNVISALGDPGKRGSHVPYRESKLTRLLQDSLGGNSRTWMLACASCADADFEETLNTLKYAHRARNIKNKPVVNQDPKGAQLAAMQDEIESLRGQLQRVSAAEIQPGNHQSLLHSHGSLALRLATAEAEGDAARKSLIDVYTTVCQNLPAIWHAPGGPPGTARQALTAVCEALQSARRLLGDALDAGREDSPSALLDGDGAAAGGIAAEVPVYSDFPLYDGELEGECPEGTERGAASLTDRRSLSEMRRDSTLLIRKYLEEIRRLESELVLYKRRTKLLQEELREAKEDLQKDEEIFQEKMQEMKALAEKLASLEVTSSTRQLAFRPACRSAFSGLGAAVSSKAQGASIEQLLDAHIQAEETELRLQADLRKQETLLRKRDQYISYRRKITARDQLENEAAAQKLQQLEAELVRADGTQDLAPLRAEHEALSLEVQNKRASGLSILHDIDERLEVIQDELDFREARIAKAKQTLASAASAELFDVDFNGLSLDVAKEMLHRYGETMVGLRKREVLASQSLASLEAQHDERRKEVAELQQVLRRQDANANKAMAQVATEYEARVQTLLGAREASVLPSAESSTAESAADIEKLRRDNEYYRSVNRELKRRLRQFLEAQPPDELKAGRKS